MLLFPLQELWSLAQYFEKPRISTEITGVKKCSYSFPHKYLIAWTTWSDFLVYLKPLFNYDSFLFVCGWSFGKLSESRQWGRAEEEPQREFTVETRNNIVRSRRTSMPLPCLPRPSIRFPELRWKCKPRRLLGIFTPNIISHHHPINCLHFQFQCEGT